MITLLTFAGDATHPSHSPFCVKVMCLLTLAGVEWTRQDIANPSKMPNSRLPVINTGTEMIADSHFIQAWLEAKGTDFNAGLSPLERAQSHAVVQMVEENLRQYLVYDRWLRDDCWGIIRDVFFGVIPRIIRGPITKKIRAQKRRDLIAHGVAQFSETERQARAAKDIGAITAILGAKPFLFGDKPTAADAATVPVLDMISTLVCDTPLRRLVQNEPTLMSYIARGRAAMYPQ